MFEFIDSAERLKIESRKIDVLQSVLKDLEDAVLELAEIVASNEEAIQEVQNG